ncbi:pseudouridine synthase [Thiohalobacter thiocyanaticus]|uniref:Ribosomal small subunit pseudouridine synthase A n=1 Tax=Thiohalobacter thiocyanaticus TaxID=585455 RepID=A0A1Z4VNE1_9GAMM|nr:pseudouridine synthase [Thiohalobacter thiocyanaticus]BAZ93140.1 pseudouridine synthase [Thiohalobacter thiocyanaticus]
MRLDRFLSQNTALTRSRARQAIRRGRVTLAGAEVRDPAAAVMGASEVCLDGAPVRVRGLRYFMLYKPVGWVSVTRHDRHPTVLDLLGVEPRAGLHAAGRLDLSASGMVLITDDGDWSHRLTSPRRHCPKRYRVTLAEPLTEAQTAALRTGVILRGESEPTRPARLEILDATTILLTLTEGRYHQVKRMCAAAGNRVVALHREAIGPLELDAALEPGQWRPLTDEEVRCAVT